MQVIRLDDLKKYRAIRIAHGNCDHDEMEALAWFINTVDTIEIGDDDAEIFMDGGKQ